MIKSFTSLFLSNRIPSASCYGIKQISTQTFPLQFKASPALWAEPLKKKKKIDPAIVKAREERKKKKLLKEIKKLQKQEKTLKPIADFEAPSFLAEEIGRRTRKVSVPVDVSEERTLLFKQWARIKLKEVTSDSMILNRLERSQKAALDELRFESEELYQSAVRIDENLLPLKYTGPTETPSKQDYPIPDGAYIDISRKWE